MKNWRKLSSTDMEWKDSENYDKDLGMNVPFSATFTGNKKPSPGDPAKKEVEDYKSQNKEFKKDLKKEEKILSPVFNRKETVEEHMKDVNKKVKTAGKWREALGAVDFKSKPDGTVEINYTQNDGLGNVEEGEQEGAPVEGLPEGEEFSEYQSPQPQSQTSFAPGDDTANITSSIRGKIIEVDKTSAVVDLFLQTGKSVFAEWKLKDMIHLDPIKRGEKKEWIIREGSNGEQKFVLVGMECKDKVGVEIRELSKTGSKKVKILGSDVKSRRGHNWQELINQAVWESKFEAFLK